jgi:hypothetical protein
MSLLIANLVKQITRLIAKDFCLFEQNFRASPDYSEA